jgi:hypothetical protein
VITIFKSYRIVFIFYLYYLIENLKNQINRKKYWLNENQIWTLNEIKLLKCCLHFFNGNKKNDSNPCPKLDIAIWKLFNFNIMFETTKLNSL